MKMLAAYVLPMIGATVIQLRLHDPLVSIAVILVAAGVGMFVEARNGLQTRRD